MEQHSVMRLGRLVAGKMSNKSHILMDHWQLYSPDYHLNPILFQFYRLICFQTRF